MPHRPVLATAVATAILAALPMTAVGAGSAHVEMSAAHTAIPPMHLKAGRRALQAEAADVWAYDEKHPNAPYSVERWSVEHRTDLGFPIAKYDQNSWRQWESPDYDTNEAGFCIVAGWYPGPGAGEGDSLMYDSLSKTITTPSEAVVAGTSTAWDPCAIWSIQTKAAAYSSYHFEEWFTDDPSIKAPMSDHDAHVFNRVSPRSVMLTNEQNLPATDPAPVGAKVWPEQACNELHCADLVPDPAFPKHPDYNDPVDVSRWNLGGNADLLSQEITSLVTKAIDSARTAWRERTADMYRRKVATYRRSHTLAQYRRTHAFKAPQPEPSIADAVAAGWTSTFDDPSQTYVLSWASNAWVTAHNKDLWGRPAFCIGADESSADLAGGDQAVWRSSFADNLFETNVYGSKPSDAASPCSGATFGPVEPTP